MKPLLAFSKRNILIYFRDKASIFYSVFSVLITFAVYLLFLGGSYLGDVPIEFKAYIQNMQDEWLMAGILAMTSFSTVFNSMGLLPFDKRIKNIDDFYSSPISRNVIAGGYIIAAIVTGLLMSTIAFICTQAFLKIRGGHLVPLSNYPIVFLYVVLSLFFSSALAFTIALYGKTPRSYGSFTNVLLTLLGFLTGIYIPIGSMSTFLQTAIKLFPISHIAALLRQVFTTKSFANNLIVMPKEWNIEIRAALGIDLYAGQTYITPWISIFFVFIVSVILLIISVHKLEKNKEK